MATLQELETALVNADKAGDTDAAKKIAGAIVEMRSQLKPVTVTDRVNAAITGGNQGIAALAGLPMDTVQNVYNLVKAGIGFGAGAAGRPDLMPELTTGTPLSSEWFARLLNKGGFHTQNPRPDDAASRMLHTGGAIVTSSGPSAITNPAATLAAATGGAVGGEVSGNPLAVAVGSSVPAVMTRTGVAAKQSIADRTKPQMEAFKEVNTQPSVGQATRLNFIQGFENLLSKFPGGQGVFRSFVENQQRELAKNTTTGASAEDAGRSIEKGVGNFLDRTKATWKQLDDRLAQKVGNFSMTPANTEQTLRALTTPTPGAENTTAALVNPKLAEIRANLAQDLRANNGQIPFDALRQLRAKVGSMLENSLVSGIPGGELKRVYSALSKDLEAAANQAGAGQEFTRQQNYYRARMDRVESVLERVIGKGRQPEDIFKSVNPTDPNQANKLRAVMRSLQPNERQVVTDAVVQRLGRATPGRQNDVGDVFSSETFLTNWNRLSPEAKTQLFPNGVQRKNLDALASVADDIRSGAKVFANPSGTAGAAAPYGLGYLAVSGNAGQAAALIGGSYIGAKMLTSPKVIEWLANAPKVKPENAAAYLARLGAIANKTQDDELRQELTQYVNSVSTSVSAR